MLIMSDLMPETSDTVPIANIFFAAALCEMTVLLIVTCYILTMHSSHKPIPLWMRRYIYDKLSFKFGVRHRTSKPTNQPNSAQVNGYNNNAVGDSITQIPSEQSNIFQLKTVKKRSKLFDATSYTEKHDTNVDNPNVDELVLRKLDIILQRFQNEDENSEVEEEWRICAYVIDQICLYFFLLVYTVTVLTCFVIPYFD